MKKLGAQVYWSMYMGILNISKLKCLLSRVMVKCKKFRDLSISSSRVMSIINQHYYILLETFWIVLSLQSKCRIYYLLSEPRKKHVSSSYDCFQTKLFIKTYERSDDNANPYLNHKLVYVHYLIQVQTTS